MSDFFKHVQGTLPVALELSPDEEEIQEAVFEAEVLGLEAESVVTVCGKVSQLCAVLDDFETFVDDTDIVALEMLEYVGGEVLSCPSVEPTERPDPYVIRAYKAVKKFIVKIYNWVKSKLKALASAITSRLGFSKNKIQQLKKDMGAGEVDVFVIELPFDPKYQEAHLKELSASFKRTRSLPKNLTPDELESLRLENDIRDRAMKKTILSLRSELTAPDSIEVKEMVNGYRITVDVEFLTSLTSYQDELKKVYSEANAVLEGLKQKAQVDKDNPDGIDIDIGKERIREAQQSMQIVTKLMKNAGDVVDQVVSKAEESKVKK